MEMGSTYSKLMIETLLNVHALTNMHRSSGNDEYRKTASEWLPRLKNLMEDLDRELQPKAKPVGVDPNYTGPGCLG